MTSRERVLRAISHKEPDRIPVDLGGMDSTTILPPAYARLRSKLGITKGKFKIVGRSDQIPEIDQELVVAFSLDALPSVFPVPAWPV